MFVDSHVNLHGERYAEDLTEVLNRASQMQVDAMLTISDRLDSLEEIEGISTAHHNIWHSVGVHPHHAKDYAQLTTELLVARAAHDKAIGIGECGLDLHYEYSELDLQKPVFAAHIEAAIETQLPLIIHTRNADEHTGKMLKEARARGHFVPLMHCYTSGIPLAEQALEMGGYVAFSGIITFKKAEDVRAVAQMVPMDRLLIETDCPFLAPVPHRGKRNEPAFLPNVAQKLAEIKSVSVDEIAKVTTDNFYRLFKKATKPSGEGTL